MPNFIYNAFKDANLIDIKQLKASIRGCKKESIVDAHLAESNIDIDLNVASTLNNPTIGKIEGSIESSKISKFSFGDLQVRTMSNLTRIEIDSYLEILKKNKWDSYDGKIRRVYMITELYYGSIKLIIDSEFKSNIEADIPKMEIDLKNTVEIGKSIEYTFDHKNVPFAMRIEKVRWFNG